MWRITAPRSSLQRLQRSWRGFCEASAVSKDTQINETLVAAVVFERAPIVIPQPRPEIAAFREFSHQIEQRKRLFYTDSYMEKIKPKTKEDKPLKYIPPVRTTEADKSNDRRSLQRALDRRLYLIVYGTPFGVAKNKHVWHLPEKLYTNEETMRKCAESALNALIGDTSSAYFVGNAPCGHLDVKSELSGKDCTNNFKRFYFKSQVIGKKGYTINCKDHLWVTRDELLEYFDLNEKELLKKMLMQ